MAVRGSALDGMAKRQVMAAKAFGTLFVTLCDRTGIMVMIVPIPVRTLDICWSICKVSSCTITHK